MLSLIHHRVINCYDLVSVEAVYHKKCFAKFSLCKHGNTEATKKSRGRPANEVMVKAFESTCEWLESIEGATTLRELQNHMKEIAGEDHTCSLVWLKQKLLEKYGSSLHLTSDGYKHEAI